MGPLTGYRFLEFAGIGPGPFAGMMLSDMGAEILRIDRKGARPWQPAHTDVMARNRRSVALDLKAPGAVAAVLGMVARADGLIEGFRPGVMERLGLGPDPCLAANQRLVYGRMTGWGQVGPLASAAGHDLNYIALSGALWSMGEASRPPMPPLNLVGDYGGGGMLLAFGMVCAVLEARQSGRGQVVDAAMTDGAALLMASHYGYLAAGQWANRRGGNLLDGSAPHYRVYECADGKWITVAPLEEPFYDQLLSCLDVDPATLPDRRDPANWSALSELFATIFARHDRDHWCRLLEGSDVCFAPVLDLHDAPAHPHNQARRAFLDIDGLVQPAPAPRFSRTPAAPPRPPPTPGGDNDTALADWGIDADIIAELREKGAL